MPRKQFETVVATAPRQELIYTEQTVAAQIPAGGSEFVEVYAPPGSFGKVQSLYFQTGIVAGATSGDHFIQVHSIGGSGDYLKGTSKMSSPLEFNMNHFLTADVNKYPPDAVSQSLVMKDVHFSDVVGIRLFYMNNTNAPKNESRAFCLRWIKTDATK